MGEELKSGEIAYNIHGEENELTLVLIHGLDSAAATFDNVIGPLSEHYRVIAYDQRGHGRTPARGLDYSSQRMAEDLAGLFDLIGVESAHVLGHSMGARTAVRFAALHPERVQSLIVEDMELNRRVKLTGRRHEEMLEEYRRRASLFSERVYSSREELVGKLAELFGPADAESLVARRARPLDGGRHELLFRPEIQVLYGTQSNADDLLEDFAGFPGPALVLTADPQYGTACPPDGIERMRQARPSAVFYPFECGHTIHRQAEAQFLFVMRSWIDRNAEAPRPELAAVVDR